MAQEVKPAIIVIFGITGDLARRKLLPALYHLTKQNLLHPDTHVVGVTRQNLTKKDIISGVEKFARTHERTSEVALRQFEKHFELYPMDMAKDTDYKRLKKRLDEIELHSALGVQRLYYLSIPPAVFDEVVALLGQSGLANPAGKENMLPSLLIEKPFGYDLASARTLIRSTKQYFKEEQIYRIDHYLAKETAQNILDFRFENNFFESIWSRHHISKVVISAFESIGIEGRANFYEQTGALRDLIQSHLLQLMALVAMERPRNLRSSSAVHRERLKLFNAVVPPLPYDVQKQAVRGQYRGYRQEVGDRHTATETFAAMQLYVNSDRWQDIPFVLRTGKALASKATQIDVHFGTGSAANVLTFRLQPNEGIHLSMRVKRPGYDYITSHSDLDFTYQRSFKSEKAPEAYERVLLDAVRQDQTLFASSDEVIASWKIIEPVLKEWAKSSDGLLFYAPKSKGPRSRKHQSIL